jgi:DNA-binding PucR family transcriptional regulator
MSILGRKGPESYLRLLREWGIYQRLRSGTTAVRVAERPDLDIRERLAIGVHAGPQFLGTIWVQEGSAPLRPQAERELRGAAVVAARHLVSRRAERSPASRLEERLLRGLLEGQDDGAAMAAQFGLDAQVRCAVVAFGLGDPDHPGDPAVAELHRGRLMTLITLHAAAFRRSAVVTMIGTRVYALLPDVEAPDADAGVLALVREIVSTASGHLGVPVRAGLGPTVSGAGDIAESRREADQVLSALARHAESVATLDDVRGGVLLADVLDRLATDSWTGDQRLSALTDHDAAHGSRLAASLLAYLDAFGDVGAAAKALHVHPNTLRYRVRQATRLTGLDLADPRERLVATLCLHRDRVR